MLDGILEHIGVILTGLAAISTTILLILQKFGMIFNNSSNKKNAHNICEELDKLRIELDGEIEKESGMAHDTHEKIFKKLEELTESISYIKGFLAQK